MLQKIKAVPIMLDKERHLLYDVNALIDLGDELGINLLTPEGWEQLAGKKIVDENTGEVTFEPVAPSFRRVRAILWAGLRHEDETLTVRQVGAMLDPTDLGSAIAAYQEAWEVQDESHEDPGASPNAWPAPAAAAQS